MAMPIASTSARIWCSCQRQTMRHVSTYPSHLSPYASGAPEASGSLCKPSTPFHALPKEIRQPGRAIQSARDTKRAAGTNEEAARQRKVEKEEKERYHVLSRPHPIYGYAPGNEHLWLDCDLRKCILDREEVWGIKDVPLSEFSTAPSLTDGFELPHALAPAERPEHLQFSLPKDGEAATVLFDLLPDLNRTRRGDVAAGAEPVDDLESRKRDNMMRLLSLRNASSQEIHKESRRRIIEAFVRKEGDTGSPEVHIALLTFRMRRLYGHMRFNPYCRQHIRELPKVYAERQRLLKRLHNMDPLRYDVCLRRCGIEPRLATAHIDWSRTGRAGRRKAKFAEWQAKHPGWNKAW